MATSLAFKHRAAISALGKGSQPREQDFSTSAQTRQNPVDYPFETICGFSAADARLVGNLCGNILVLHPVSL
jgi:hypothetical protein